MSQGIDRQRLQQRLADSLPYFASADKVESLASFLDKAGGEGYNQKQKGRLFAERPALLFRPFLRHRPSGGVRADHCFITSSKYKAFYRLGPPLPAFPEGGKTR